MDSCLPGKEGEKLLDYLPAEKSYSLISVTGAEAGAEVPGVSILNAGVDVRVLLARLVSVAEVWANGGGHDGQGVAVQLVEEVDDQQRQENVQRVDSSLRYQLPHPVARYLLLVPAHEGPHRVVLTEGRLPLRRFSVAIFVYFLRGGEQRLLLFSVTQPLRCTFAHLCLLELLSGCASS